MFALLLSLKLLIEKNEKISQEDTESDAYNGEVDIRSQPEERMKFSDDDDEKMTQDVLDMLKEDKRKEKENFDRETLFARFDETIRDEAIRFAIKLNEFRVTEEDKYKEEAEQILEEIKDKIKKSLQVEYEVIEVLFKSYLRNLEAEFLGSD